MDNSEDEMEEDETEWKSSFTDAAPLSSATTAAGKVMLETELGKFIEPETET